MDRFRAADERYNSGLFDFRKDTVTPGLKGKIRSQNYEV